jgi:hypothetical protein
MDTPRPCKELAIPHRAPHPIDPPPFITTKQNTHTAGSDIHAFNISRAIFHGRAKGTLNNYASAVRTYETWCNAHNIHKSLQFPATEYVLCAFASSFLGTRSGTTVSGLLAGVKAWHTAHNAPWNTSSRLLLVTRGVASEAPSHSKRPPRKPVTPAMLSLLAKHLDGNAPLDIAVLAVALVAFWAQCRLGELLGTSKLKHDPAKQPSRSFIGPPISSNGSRELLLPSTKTHGTHGETVVLTFQKAPLDPIAAIEKHLYRSRHIPRREHLFAFDTQKPQTSHCLTKAAFLKRCNQIWSQHGHTRITGHSFRIGGTTSLLHAGISPDVVRTMGRWASDVHFRYWRGTTDIALEHAENLSESRIRKDTNVPIPTRATLIRTKRTKASHRGRPY